MGFKIELRGSPYVTFCLLEGIHSHIETEICLAKNLEELITIFSYAILVKFQNIIKEIFNKRHQSNFKQTSLPNAVKAISNIKRNLNNLIDRI